MSSTFSGLSGALSSLYAQRRGLDVTGQNIANANTDGYSRQRVDLEAVNSTVPAIFAKSDGVGGGVTVKQVTRLQDTFLEARTRLEHAQSTYLDDQNSVYARIEEVFGEPSDTGLQSQFSDLTGAWHDLADQPGDPASRTQVLARAQTIVDTMHATSASLGSLFSNTREQFDAYATDVNTSATQVAALNKSIVIATQTGLPTNELSDQRDKLILHLSELTGATALARDNGAMDVFLGGSSLVSGPSARQLTTTGALRIEDTAATPVALQWVDNSAPVGIESGQMASMLRTMNTTLPSYSDQLDQVAATFAGAVNTQHEAGYDLNGDQGLALFDSNDGQPINARNIMVAISDPNLLAAASSTGGSGSGTLDGGNAHALAKIATSPNSPDQAYRQVIVNLGVQAQSADNRATVQASLRDDIDAARQASTGVNLDEEMTNLMSYQRGYQAAARVMNAIDATLDTLINHLGS
jgi:flagellar hook-associated protein 1 FlgK